MDGIVNHIISDKRGSIIKIRKVSKNADCRLNDIN